jgi:serine protease AprX
LGSGSSGNDKRSNSGWSKGGRGIVALLVLAALVVPASSAAHSASKTDWGNPRSTANVPASLLAQAQANPQELFPVIVEGTGGWNSSSLAQNVANWAAHSESRLVNAANQAAASFQQDQATASTLTTQATQAQQNAGLAQAFAAATAIRPGHTATNAARAAAAAAAQAAAAKAAAAAQAAHAAQVAQTGVAQAQAADNSAQAAFGTEANSIVDNHLKNAFTAITADAISLTGEQIVGLASHGSNILSITPDLPVAAQAEMSADDSPSPSALIATDPNPVPDASMWPSTSDVTPLWNATDPNTGAITGPAPQAPAIAIVDSGVDASNPDFGGRVVASVDLSSLDPNETGDQEGHGTMVAGIAAGSSSDYPSVAQNAPIVDVHTADANGESLTSDVIAACDWILANKDKYDIRVANFSMAGNMPTSFQYDPLDQAVESLWFNGIVVVAAAGNEGTGNGPVDMSAAPGNDPFIITVGAVDQNETSDPSDDTVPWWSAYGYTDDGFSKPDIAAPGRYMVGPVPMNSTLATAAPDRIVAPGYMWMSGTSFAAPVVAGAAAQILALHPDWTPDEVKGAMMLTAAYLPNDTEQAAGVGEIDAASAASLPFDPPNPNENLEAFVTTDPTTGQPVFDSAAWASAVQSDAAWSSAAWASAAWGSAAWNSAAWASAAWSSSVFTANTTSAMQSLASWSSSTFAP